MRQGSLFGPVWLVDPRDEIERRFAEFHERNPHILRELESRAMTLMYHGVTRIGIALLYESMRYDALTRTKSVDYKLNNDYRALYARLLIDRHPELAGVIETRRRQESAA